MSFARRSLRFVPFQVLANFARLTHSHKRFLFALSLSRSLSLSERRGRERRNRLFTLCVSFRKNTLPRAPAQPGTCPSVYLSVLKPQCSRVCVFHDTQQLSALKSTNTVAFSVCFDVRAVCWRALYVRALVERCFRVREAGNNLFAI